MRHLSDVLLHLSRALDLNSHITTFLLCDFFDKCSNQDLAEECFLHLVSPPALKLNSNITTLLLHMLVLTTSKNAVTRTRTRPWKKDPKKCSNLAEEKCFVQLNAFLYLSPSIAQHWLLSNYLYL